MKLVDRRQCTGCFACRAVCPAGCIQVEEDELGNPYPEIDPVSCRECGLCGRVCPEQCGMEFREIQQAYAVWSLDAAGRKRSASGGAAAEFYAEAIDQGWLICGVAYQDEFRAVHILSNEKKDIEAFRQSKYVYSEMTDIYEGIRIALKEQKKVLFISLPCKVAGLKSWLRGNEENLLTVDIICHGTPSCHLLQEHIRNMADISGGCELGFREENEFRFWLRNHEGEKLYCRTGRTDTYLAAFLEGLDYRASCYQCKYARPERIADLTIGDFWGLGSVVPFDHPYTGSVSAVMINSEKGRVFFEQCKDRLFAEERPVEEAVRGNAQLNSPTPEHRARKEFEEVYGTAGFEQAVKACLADEIRQERKTLAKRRIRAGLRTAAGVFIRKYR